MRNKDIRDIASKIEYILIAVDEGRKPVQQALNEVLLLISNTGSICICKVCGKYTDYNIDDKLCSCCW